MGDFLQPFIASLKRRKQGIATLFGKKAQDFILKAKSQFSGPGILGLSLRRYGDEFPSLIFGTFPSLDQASLLHSIQEVGQVAFVGAKKIRKHLLVHRPSLLLSKISQNGVLDCGQGNVAQSLAKGFVDAEPDPSQEYGESFFRLLAHGSSISPDKAGPPSLTLRNS